jgi:hypothetical protein
MVEFIVTITNIYKLIIEPFSLKFKYKPKIGFSHWNMF